MLSAVPFPVGDAPFSCQNLLPARYEGNLSLFLVKSIGCQECFIFLFGPVKCIEKEKDSLHEWVCCSIQNGGCAWGSAGKLSCALHLTATPICKGSHLCSWTLPWLELPAAFLGITPSHLSIDGAPVVTWHPFAAALLHCLCCFSLSMGPEASAINLPTVTTHECALPDSLLLTLLCLSLYSSEQFFLPIYFKIFWFLIPLWRENNSNELNTDVQTTQNKVFPLWKSTNSI